MTKLDRRAFLQTAATALGAATVGRAVAQAGPSAPGAASAQPAGILVIASANGLAACERAFHVCSEGQSPVDAAVAGVNLVEDDPADHTVGLGGLPNEDGIVELDSSVMDGVSHKAGAVASLRNIRNPSLVALRVMRRTDHVLLVGEGALRFARAHGFKEEELLTDESRAIWLRWKESHSERDDWIPEPSAVGSARGFEAIPQTYGTITCLVRDNDGNLGGCTTTSGLSYKIPGRVGDSPIIGAGLYVDNAIGACGSTGRGEANLLNLSSYQVVSYMEQGLTPEEACLKVLKRVSDRAEPRLRNEKNEANFQLKLYALRKDGMTGGAVMWENGAMAVRSARQNEVVPIPALFS
ncbi:MAG: N(4)-(beta-N-acetylglucosaminyl)-L-asparaginase [Phycisphaerae bacterium]